MLHNNNEHADEDKATQASLLAEAHKIQRHTKALGMGNPYIIPMCGLCGFVLYIHENGIIEHTTNDWCIDSGKRYKFISADPEKGQYSHTWLFKQYKNISIEEIKDETT